MVNMDLNVVKTYFKTIDIIVFAITLMLAAIIGAYYGYKDRKKTPTNYYFGGKKMSPFPVGISTAVSFISAVTVMTYPSEAYTYGTVVIWYAFATIIPVITACLYFIPLYHRLQLRTIYEYLEKRFSITIRKFSSAIEIINQVFYMGIAIYLPALALNAVTPLHLYWTIALTGGICTFYTSLGGIKAVIWTDTLQAFVMFLGVLAAFVKAVIEIGGLGNAWKSLERNNANNIWSFDPDPRLRTTIWTIFLGMGCVQTTIVCINQSVAQRYLSCKSINQAQKAAICTLIPKISIGLCCIFGGLLAFAYFEGCDPIKNKLLAKPEQIMPYLVLVLFSNLPGLAGLYVAAVFSATLSTVSSGINALAAQMLEDFVLPKKQMSIREKIIFSKTAVFLLGMTVTAIAYVATLLSGSVIKIVFILKGACGGPMVGVFFLAMFFPWATSKGAFAGQIVGTLLSTWIAIGNFVYGASPKFLRKIPTTTNNCSYVNQFGNITTPRVLLNEEMMNRVTSPNVEHTSGQHYPALYSLSFAYNSVVGLLSSIIVGLVISFVTGANQPRDMDPRFFVPIVDNNCLPKSIRLFFRFGVPLLNKNNKCKDPEKLLLTNKKANISSAN